MQELDLAAVFFYLIPYFVSDPSQWAFGNILSLTDSNRRGERKRGESSDPFFARSPTQDGAESIDPGTQLDGTV